MLTLSVLRSQFAEQVRVQYGSEWNLMFPGLLWRFSNTLHLNSYCKFSPTSQYFFSAHDKNELDEELWCWEISNNRRQAKFKNHFLLATRLLNANCIWSRLLLPSLIAHARKTSSSFPQFAFPAIFPPFLSNDGWLQKCYVHFCNWVRSN